MSVCLTVMLQSFATYGCFHPCLLIGNLKFDVRKAKFAVIKLEQFFLLFQFNLNFDSKESLRTILWRLLHQHIGRFQNDRIRHPPSIYHYNNCLVGSTLYLLKSCNIYLFSYWIIPGPFSFSKIFDTFNEATLIYKCPSVWQV